MPEKPTVLEEGGARRTVGRNGQPLRRTRSVPLTDAEYQLVDEAARLCGKPTGAFIREAALGVRLQAQPFLADAELIRELGRSGMALARLAAAAQASGAVPEALGLEAALAELRALVRRIASAHPTAAAR
jgi:hypothetical protein